MRKNTIVFAVFLMLPLSLYAYNISAISAAGFPFSNSDLNIDGMEIEDFEDATLANGLNVGTGDTVNLTTNFNFNTDIVNSSALAWDGTNSLGVTSSFTWLEFTPGTRSVAFGVSDAESTTPDIVLFNGSTAVSVFNNPFSSFGGFGNGVRNFYFRIDAQEGEADIERLRLDISINFPMTIDRVAFGVATTPPIPEPSSFFALLLSGLILFKIRKN